MGKVILDLAVTLDGHIEGPNGEIDWLVKDDKTDFGDILFEILDGVDAIFYGRKSYEAWGNYQPGENTGTKLRDAYKLLHSKTKYVFSTKLKSDGSNTVFINSGIREKVLNLKRDIKGHIWLYGGGDLITSFVNLGLVDEYRLAVHPVILGEGKLLFKNINKRLRLKLTNTRSSSSGVVLLTYTAENGSS
ncbi:dihydrofolate reductase family protein [Sinomicrobium weinanense]|uniref:Dihydrofolate reductase n=1 Tax=Sinomicrobium weinanense TaxID=2842200 RepID=A0A926Q5K2_9FLAO|nr:dihydrofolate reductase family protein [Sinomicrobium weinanense]MBC9798251.1 dihydrofolate reductase [Sinomicrobium weinanense]MBU3122644.1 dihydrofolate reductase family protein [Sinomicrobium weinanense]